MRHSCVIPCVIIRRQSASSRVVPSWVVAWVVRRGKPLKSEARPSDTAYGRKPE